MEKRLKRRRLNEEESNDNVDSNDQNALIGKEEDIDSNDDFDNDSIENTKNEIIFTATPASVAKYN